MAILRNLAKLGLAKKAVDEARKPENQRRIKAMIDSAKAKRSGGGQPPKP